MSARFADKTVVITGASAGVGAEAARMFADEGASLALVARRAEPLQKVAAELSAATLIVPMDVADQASVSSLFDKVATRFGGVDVLVNNAGCHHRGAFADLEPDQVAQMVDVNLRAPLLLMNYALAHLSRGAAIVNVASIAGKMPIPMAATYSATKFGLRAFSHAVAEELRDRGVRVSCVSPGPIDTGFIMGELDKVPDYYFSQPMSSPQQVAALVLRAAAGDDIEYTVPRHSGYLATLGYLFPAFSRRVRPLLARKGRRIKEHYRRKCGA